MPSQLGMDLTEIERICSNVDLDRGIAPWIYWTSEAYGFGRAIREFAGYPTWLPLAVYSDHSGPRFGIGLDPHEEHCGAPLFLTHRKEVEELYRLRTGRLAATMTSPAVLHRRRHGFAPLDTAEGTVAFPTHRIPTHEVHHSIEAYASCLRDLPPEYQPVRVCLHMHDVDVGIHRIYASHGIPVVTAGSAFDRRFLDRFYHILAGARAATSDCVGTATLYALEMGIPFFLRGEEAVILNRTDPNYVVGRLPLPHDVWEYRQLTTLLGRFPPEQERQFQAKAIARSLLGIDEGVSAVEMSRMLRRALAEWVLNPVNLLDSFRFILSRGRIRPKRSK